MESTKTTLDKLILKGKEIVDAMIPEQKAKMLRRQAEGWARSEVKWAKDFREGHCERD